MRCRGGERNPYEATAAPGKAHKRIIERVARSTVRTILRRCCGRRLAIAGPAGEGYKQALTAGLLEVFAAKPRQPNSLKSCEPRAAYRSVDGELPLWLSSGRIFYTRMRRDPALELRTALDNFFLAHRYLDPFGIARLCGTTNVSAGAGVYGDPRATRRMRRSTTACCSRMPDRSNGNRAEAASMPSGCSPARATRQSRRPGGRGFVR